MKKWAPLLMMCAACACTATGGGESQPAAPLGDKYATPMGEVFVYPVGHGSVMLSWNGKTIQVDPYSKVADYSQLPQADLLLITHDHYDHLDPAAWKKTVKPTTHIITTAKAAPQMDGVTPQVMQNGEKTAWEGIQIDAVPAYNIVHKGPDGNFFHPKGEGNGYILHFGKFRIYIAGDTENIPEMQNWAGPDVAFLPKNLPYTMTDEMFADAALRLKPKHLYPYHYFEADKPALQKAVGKDIQLH